MPDDCFCMKLSVAWIFEFYLTVFEYICLCSLRWALRVSYRASLNTIFISTNSSSLQNGSGFPLTKKDIFSTQGKEFLSVWWNCRMPMSSIVLIQLLGIPQLTHQRKIQSPQNINLFWIWQVWCSKWVAFRRVFLFRQTQSLT